MKVRTKQVVRSVMHFTDNNTDKLEEFIGDLRWDFASPSTLAITSNGNKKIVSYNDYLIKDDSGSVWPCKPDIFAKTYKIIEPGKCMKVSVEMEAISISKAFTEEIVEFCKDDLHSIIKDDNDLIRGYVLKTLEGNVVALDDDFIIRGVKNEIWPVRKEIFEKSYDII